MLKERILLLVIAAMVLGTGSGLIGAQQTAKPAPAPVSLVWAPNEPGDGCYIDKPVFWITNHTGKTLDVKIKAVEIRQGLVWVPFSPPSTLYSDGQLHYRKQQRGTPKDTRLLGPHQVDYCHVTTHRIVLPTNVVWRVRASVSDLLVGGDKMVAAAKSEPALLAIRLRTRNPDISANPKDISYWGPAVEVYSQEVVPPSVTQQLPSEPAGANPERVVNSKPPTNARK